MIKSNSLDQLKRPKLNAFALGTIFGVIQVSWLHQTAETNELIVIIDKLYPFTVTFFILAPVFIGLFVKVNLKEVKSGYQYYVDPIHFLIWSFSMVGAIGILFIEINDLRYGKGYSITFLAAGVGFLLYKQILRFKRSIAPTEDQINYGILNRIWNFEPTCFSATLCGVWTAVGTGTIDLYSFSFADSDYQGIARLLGAIVFFFVPGILFVIGRSNLGRTDLVESIRLMPIVGLRMLCWFLGAGFGMAISIMLGIT